MLKYLKNIYVIAILGFAFWMIFWDSNSFLIHNELNNQIDKLESEKAYYQNEILKDKKAMKALNSKDGLEKFAREEYYLKRENEDIYIIEYKDSLNLKKND